MLSFLVIDLSVSFLENELLEDNICTVFVYVSPVLSSVWCGEAVGEFINHWPWLVCKQQLTQEEQGKNQSDKYLSSRLRMGRPTCRPSQKLAWRNVYMGYFQRQERSVREWVGF